MKISYYNLLNTISAFKKLFNLTLEFDQSMSLIKFLDSLEKEQNLWNKTLAELRKKNISSLEIINESKKATFEIEIPIVLSFDFLKKHSKQLNLSVSELHALSKFIEE